MVRCKRKNSAAEKRPRLRHHGGRQLRASAAGDRRRGRGGGGSGGGVGPATQTQPVAADGQRRTGDLRRQRRGAKACSGRLTHGRPEDWIALGGCVAGALIVGAGVGSVATEWRRLWRLRQRAHERDEARDMLHSHAVGKAKAFCEKLAQQAGLDQSHPALQRWYAAIHETQSDREVVSLYAQLVQPVLDARARREISRSAAESTLMIAVSPLALVDMAFIARRNLRLINRIATLYGIELGYYSRLRLFRWCC